jgi:hypothetical protein
VKKLLRECENEMELEYANGMSHVSWKMLKADGFYIRRIECQVHGREGPPGRRCSVSDTFKPDYQAHPDGGVLRELGRLTERNAALKAEVARLGGLLEGRVDVTEIHFADGSLDLLGTHPLIPVIASEMAEMLRHGPGNHVAMSARDKTGQEFSVIVQRSYGKTPEQRIKELEADNEAEWLESEKQAQTASQKEKSDE